MFTRFKELSNGDTFDFIDDANQTGNSFYRRCKKIGQRHYVPVDGLEVYTIGTVMCRVFHVDYAPIKL